jgi:hypothetical protein
MINGGKLFQVKMPIEKNGNSKSPHTNDELDGEDAVETENEAQH